MKIIYQEPESSPKFANSIPIGQCFTGTIGCHTGLFLKSFDHIVFLDNPEATWDQGDAPVDNYRPVNVTVTVEAK